jgi:hypothetical protein
LFFIPYILTSLYDFCVGILVMESGGSDWGYWRGGEVNGGTEMGLERGWNQVCLACWVGIFHEGLGGSIEEGIVRLLIRVS